MNGIILQLVNISGYQAAWEGDVSDAYLVKTLKPVNLVEEVTIS